MRISSKVVTGASALVITLFMGADAANAGCTANLSAARELNLRSGPSTNYRPLTKIPGQACNIDIGQCDDGWCEVEYSGVQGYASEFYLRRTNSSTDSSQTIKKWINVAERIFSQLADDPDWENLGTVEVGRERDRSVIQLDRRDGRFDALRMRVRGSDVDFRRVVVVYGNGARHRLDMNRVVDAGEETGELELRGQRGRFIDRIVLVHEKARRRGGPAEVQVWARKTGEGRDRPGRDNPRVGFGQNWDRLGETTADRSRDRDVIQLNRRDGNFDALGLTVSGNDLRIREMRVRYGNGVEHAVNVDRRINAGQRSDPIELRGQQGRFIDRVVLVYDTVGRGQRANVVLWGRNTQKDAQKPDFGPNWDRLGQKEVDRQRDRDVVEIDRKDGRFDSLRIRVLDNDVRIRRMRVQYGNGVAHDVDVDRRVNAGQHTDPIELRGRQGRFIKRVELFYDTVGRGPKATVELWGHKTQG